MNIYASESELLEVLDRVDTLIAACAKGTLDFHSFHQQIGHLHSYYALDGHESDNEEMAILDRHRSRIEWIERVLEKVAGVCADEDATKEAYITAGRYGSAEALRRLQSLVEQPTNERAESGPGE